MMSGMYTISIDVHVYIYLSESVTGMPKDASSPVAKCPLPYDFNGSGAMVLCVGGTSDPGIIPLGEIKNTKFINSSPTMKSNTHRMMLRDLGEAVRGMLDDAGYIFSEEYEVCIHRIIHLQMHVCTCITVKFKVENCMIHLKQ